MLPVSSGGAFKPRNRGLQLDQGDILANVPLVNWKDGKAKEAPNRAVVTSHGCVCEDYERATEAKRSGAAERVQIQVAPLVPADNFKEKINLIREGKLLDFFFIEGDGQKLKHQVAVLAREQPVPASLLVDCPTIAQLADWQWEALRLHLTVARYRCDPKEIFRDELLVGREAG